MLVVQEVDTPLSPQVLQQAALSSGPATHPASSPQQQPAEAPPPQAQQQQQMHMFMQHQQQQQQMHQQQQQQMHMVCSCSTHSSSSVWYGIGDDLESLVAVLQGSSGYYVSFKCKAASAFLGMRMNLQGLGALH